MNTQPVSIAGMIAFALLLINSVIFETAVVNNENYYQALWVTLPVFFIALYYSKRKKAPAVKTNRNYQLSLQKK